MQISLSGIKPTGLPHIGNYFGAIKQHIDFQDKYDGFYFIADLHSIISTKDPKLLKQHILEIALTYLALGLDPNKSTIYKQSSIPAHAELCWILDCFTQVPFLERAHAWKDALAKGKREKNVGLFNYPILMAADILLYSADFVPVGKDQKQHVEMARDIAQTFNHNYSTETLKLPEALILKNVETIQGTDGQKMSKSYNNTIEIFANEKTLKKQIMGIVTDSKGLEDPKDPESCNVYAIYKYFATKEEQKEMVENYKKGGYGYGHAKTALLKKILDYFKEARENYQKLKENPKKVIEIVEEGTKKAKKIADKKIEEIKEIVGLSL